MPSARPTPRLDALVSRLAAALEEPGLKADLARILEREGGITFQAAKNRLSRILGRTILPNGEDTLLLADWLSARTATRPPSTRSPRSTSSAPRTARRP